MVNSRSMEKLTSTTAKAMTIAKAAVFLMLTLSLTVSQALAVVPAAEMLPETTCMYVSCPDMNAFQASFDRTQLGLLAQDPVMKPFAEDLATQLKDRLGRTEIEFGVKLDDLKGVWGGEACLARVQPGNDKADHASILIIDVTGKEAQVAKVKASIATNMAKRNATTGTLKIGNANVTGYTLPRKRGHVKAAEAYLTVFQDQLIVSNHAKLIADVLNRAETKAKEGSLANLKMFSEVMAQVQADSKELKPHARWFVNPFKLAEVIQASQRGRGTRVRNLSDTLAKQGFDAIRGVGGHVNLATDGYEAIHRTFVFAPPVTATTKYVAAARMLFFPTSTHIPAPTWLPRNLATYTSFNWRVLDGFNYSVPLIEEVINSEFVEELLKDMYAEVGVDFRKDLMAHLDDHIIMFSDFRLPITTTSERLLVAVRVKPDKVAEVQKALDLLGDFEPQAKPILIAGQKAWEIVSPNEADEDLGSIELPPTGIPLPGGAPPDAKAEDELALPNAAIVISTGPNPKDPPYLFIASDVDLLHEVLSKRKKFNTLGQSDDFKFVSKLLKDLGAGEDCVRTFARSDEEFRSTYEMIRQGKMPQSESMLGKLLNIVLGPDDKSSDRKPEVKGDKLPDYQIVRRYLGPSGVFVQPHANGWSVTGIMVSKQQVLDAEEASAKSILTSSSN